MTSLEIMSFYVKWIDPNGGNGKIDGKEANQIANKLKVTTKMIIENYHNWVGHGYPLSVIENDLLYK